MNKLKKHTSRKFRPDGFNIGININEDAGQTILHCHIHIIPRYKMMPKIREVKTSSLYTKLTYAQPKHVRHLSLVTTTGY
jgi:diadenosine tetraphosphate (Ap4A) HIT family hydrolase